MKKYLIIISLLAMFSAGFTLNNILEPNAKEQLNMKTENTPKVTGIGGIFFKCENPDKINYY